MPGSVLKAGGEEPPPEAPPAPGGFAVHAGEAALLGSLAALVASLPAAVRTATLGPSVPLAWIGAAAMLALPFSVAVAIGRSARRTWRDLTDGHGQPALAGVAAWVAIALPLYAFLGTVLKATTHHRALGGATFGVLAVVLALVAALAAWRVVAFAVDLVARKPTRRTAVVSAGLLLFAFALATPVGRAILSTGLGLADLPAPTRAAFVDASLALVTIPLAVAVDLGPSWRTRLSLAGLPLVALFTAAGALALATTPGLGDALGRRAALAGPVAASLGLARTELDGPGPMPLAPAPRR